ncbi:MAG: hypothetical protein QM674_04780 [Burkholderiaceae bacterium]
MAFELLAVKVIVEVSPATTAKSAERARMAGQEAGHAGVDEAEDPFNLCYQRFLKSIACGATVGFPSPAMALNRAIVEGMASSLQVHCEPTATMRMRGMLLSEAVRMYVPCPHSANIDQALATRS